MTVFQLQIVYKLQAIEMKSSSQLTYLYVLDHINTNIRSDRVQVIEFPHRSTKLYFWTAHWGSVGTFQHMVWGVFLHMIWSTFLHKVSVTLHMASK